METVLECRGEGRMMRMSELQAGLRGVIRRFEELPSTHFVSSLARLLPVLAVDVALVVEL